VCAALIVSPGTLRHAGSCLIWDHPSCKALTLDQSRPSASALRNSCSLSINLANPPSSIHWTIWRLHNVWRLVNAETFNHFNCCLLTTCETANDYHQSIHMIHFSVWCCVNEIRCDGREAFVSHIGCIYTAGLDAQIRFSDWLYPIFLTTCCIF